MRPIAVVPKKRKCCDSLLGLTMLPCHALLNATIRFTYTRASSSGPGIGRPISLRPSKLLPLPRFQFRA